MGQQGLKNFYTHLAVVNPLVMFSTFGKTQNHERLKGFAKKSHDDVQKNNTNKNYDTLLGCVKDSDTLPSVLETRY